MRYSVRMLIKSAGFTAVAIVSLAPGIGANTAIFTLINDPVFKSLPVRYPQQLVSQLLSFFSLLALSLACIGLYGVMTYNVVRRTNEIGIRLALGAQTGRVLWMVLRESLLLLGIGVALGMPLTLAATRLIQSGLFGLRSWDPATLAGAVALVGAVTMLAAYFPARRAMKVDPMVALRYE